MKGLARQFSAFLGVGVAATALHYAVLICLVEMFGVAAPPAALAGALAGAVLSYGENRRRTFSSTRSHRSAGLRFGLVALGAAGLTYALMRLFVDGLGAPYIPAQMVASGIVTIWTFAAHRLWTFREPPRAAGS
ncbi:GtrA family protein [Methylocella sp.]|uniref:GtrA family protein n=1 Tax=Methylocella sp. TaxID=1978226 RepID=UPI003782FD5F